MDCLVFGQSSDYVANEITGLYDVDTLPGITASARLILTRQIVAKSKWSKKKIGYVPFISAVS